MLVGFSHEKVGQATGEYLIKKGYRRPGLLWTDDRRAAQRKQGLCDIFFVMVLLTWRKSMFRCLRRCRSDVVVLLSYLPWLNLMSLSAALIPRLRAR